MAQWYYISNGQQKGPVSQEDLKSLVMHGIVRPSDLVWSVGMTNWAAASTIFNASAGSRPPSPPPFPWSQDKAGTHYKPHRATTVLVLGILGLVSCPILGIIAWSMGKNDIAEMQQGRMDPGGYSQTNAGRICGMIASILLIVQAIFALILIIASGFFGHLR